MAIDVNEQTLNKLIALPEVEKFRYSVKGEVKLFVGLPCSIVYRIF